MDTSPCLKIERKSSIEEEPRTLTFDQIKYARVAISFLFLHDTKKRRIRRKEDILDQFAYYILLDIYMIQFPFIWFCLPS